MGSDSVKNFLFILKINVLVDCAIFHARNYLFGYEMNKNLKLSLICKRRRTEKCALSRCFQYSCARERKNERQEDGCEINMRLCLFDKRR